MYAASVETSGLEKIVEVLSEVVWRPLISPEEVLNLSAILFT